MFRKSRGIFWGIIITWGLIFSGITAPAAYAGPNAGASMAVDLDVDAPGIQSNATVLAGDNLEVEVIVQGALNLRGVNFELVYDSGALEVLSVNEGDFLKSTGESTFPIINYTTPGEISGMG